MTPRDDLLRKYKQRLERELGGIPSPHGHDVVSREYKQFRKESIPQHVSVYEKMCSASEKILKIKVPPKKAEEMQAHINITHMNITPSGILALSYLLPLAVLVFGSLLSLLLLNSLFFAFIFVLAGLLLIAILQKYPTYLANNWRLKASNQMVLCVFYVVTYMRHTSNLENAIAFAAEHLSPPLSLDLKKVLWDVETEKYENVKESLDAYLETWRRWNREFIESFHLIESSLYETSEQRRLELLDKSLDVILQETYEKMLHYAHNLKSPITTLHMLGIILPVLGLVILPLVVSFIGGVQWYHLAMLYNVFLPIVVYYLGRNILSTRPTGYGDTDIAEVNPGLKKYRNVLFKIGKKEVAVNPLIFSIILGLIFFSIALLPILINTFAPGFAASIDASTQEAIGLPLGLGQKDEVQINPAQMTLLGEMLMSNPAVRSCLNVNRSYVVGGGPRVEFSGSSPFIGVAREAWNRRFAETYADLAGDILDHIQIYGFFLIKVVDGVPSVIKDQTRDLDEAKDFTESLVRDGGVEIVGGTRPNVRDLEDFGVRTPDDDLTAGRGGRKRGIDDDNDDDFTDDAGADTATRVGMDIGKRVVLVPVSKGVIKFKDDPVTYERRYRFYPNRQGKLSVASNAKPDDDVIVVVHRHPSDDGLLTSLGVTLLPGYVEAISDTEYERRAADVRSRDRLLLEHSDPFVNMTTEQAASNARTAGVAAEGRLERRLEQEAARVRVRGENKALVKYSNVMGIDLGETDPIRLREQIFRAAPLGAPTEHPVGNTMEKPSANAPKPEGPARIMERRTAFIEQACTVLGVPPNRLHPEGRIKADAEGMDQTFRFAVRDKKRILSQLFTRFIYDPLFRDDDVQFMFDRWRGAGAKGDIAEQVRESKAVVRFSADVDYETIEHLYINGMMKWDVARPMIADHHMLPVDVLATKPEKPHGDIGHMGDPTIQPRPEPVGNGGSAAKRKK